MAIFTSTASGINVNVIAMTYLPYTDPNAPGATWEWRDVQRDLLALESPSDGTRQADFAVRGDFSYSLDGSGAPFDITGRITRIDGAQQIFDSGTRTGKAGSWTITGIDVDVSLLQAANWFSVASALFSGDDSIQGSDGRDQLRGYGGHDIMRGGRGNDTFFGDEGNDTIHGGEGNDSYLVGLVQGGLEDLVRENADAGIDSISIVRSSAYGPRFVLEVPRNIEHLDASSAVHAALDLRGNELANSIVGNQGRNVLNGGGGRDTLEGRIGNDVYIVPLLAGGNMEDVVNDQGAVADVDTIRLVGSYEGTRAVALTMQGDIENFDLRGAGASRLDVTGNARNNVIHGTSVGNLLAGADGGDQLHGERGWDILAGGLGTDTLYGGAGGDVFDFNTVAELQARAWNTDIVRDFSAAERDLVDLRDIDADASGAGNGAFRFIGTRAFDADATGQLRFRYDSGTGMGVLYGSLDADATPEFTIRLQGVRTLDAASILL